MKCSDLRKWIESYEKQLAMNEGNAGSALKTGRKDFIPFIRFALHTYLNERQQYLL